jgi:hypothetical protein
LPVAPHLQWQIAVGRWPQPQQVVVTGHVLAQAMAQARVVVVVVVVVTVVVVVVMPSV